MQEIECVTPVKAPFVKELSAKLTEVLPFVGLVQGRHFAARGRLQVAPTKKPTSDAPCRLLYEKRFRPPLQNFKNPLDTIYRAVIY